MIKFSLTILSASPRLGGLVLLLLTAHCLLLTASAQDYAKWVNPFIGTGGHGHTFPGATMPFGMVQLSPDTRIDIWSFAHDADRRNPDIVSPSIS